MPALVIAGTILLLSSDGSRPLSCFTGTCRTTAQPVESAHGHDTRGKRSDALATRNVQKQYQRLNGLGGLVEVAVQITMIGVKRARSLWHLSRQDNKTQPLLRLCTSAQCATIARFTVIAAAMLCEGARLSAEIE